MDRKIQIGRQFCHVTILQDYLPVTVYHEGSYVVIYSGSIRTRLLHNVTSQSYIGVKTLSPPPLLQCMEPNAGFW